MPSAKTATAKGRRSVNLTIPADVIETAKALKLNASEAAEAGIRRAIAEKQTEQWHADNRPAIEAHNARVATDGVLLTPDWTEDYGVSGRSKPKGSDPFDQEERLRKPTPPRPWTD